MATKQLDPAQQYAQLIASLLPQSQAIPSFDQSGLYDPTAANAQYEAEFTPYWQRQLGSLDTQKGYAQEALQRALQNINAQSGQQTSAAQQEHDLDEAKRQMDLQQSMRQQSGQAAQMGQTGSGVAQYEQGQIQKGSDLQHQQIENILQQQKAQADQYKNYATGSYQQDYNQKYEGPNSAYAQGQQDINDQNTIQRRAYQTQLKNEAYQRYLQRYQNQPSY